jgi:SEC-C motif
MTGKPGRNDACPCGSGRKYKQCCLDGDQDVDRLVETLRRTEDAAVDVVTQFIAEKYGSDLLHVAWTDFILADELQAFDEDGPEVGLLFFPWFLCNWVPDRAVWAAQPGTPADELPRRPLALEYLDAAGDNADPAVARFLRAACAEPFSFFVIVAARLRRSLTLRDVFTDRETTVVAPSGDEFPPGNLLYARIGTIDDTAMLFGCTSFDLAAECHAPLTALRDEIAPGRTPTLDDLHAHADDLRDIYWQIVAQEDDPDEAEPADSEEP